MPTTEGTPLKPAADHHSRAATLAFGLDTIAYVAIGSTGLQLLVGLVPVPDPDEHTSHGAYFALEIFLSTIGINAWLAYSVCASAELVSSWPFVLLQATTNVSIFALQAYIFGAVFESGESKSGSLCCAGFTSAHAAGVALVASLASYFTAKACYTKPLLTVHLVHAPADAAAAVTGRPEGEHFRVPYEAIALVTYLAYAAFYLLTFALWLLHVYIGIFLTALLAYAACFAVGAAGSGLPPWLRRLGWLSCLALTATFPIYELGEGTVYNWFMALVMGPSFGIIGGLTVAGALPSASLRESHPYSSALVTLYVVGLLAVIVPSVCLITVLEPIRQLPEEWPVSSSWYNALPDWLTCFEFNLFYVWPTTYCIAILTVVMILARGSGVYGELHWLAVCVRPTVAA